MFSGKNIFVLELLRALILYSVVNVKNSDIVNNPYTSEAVTKDNGRGAPIVL